MENSRKQILNEIYHDQYKSILVSEANIRSLESLDSKMIIGTKPSKVGGIPVQFTVSDALEIEKENKESMERVLKIIREMRDEDKINN